jgi:hypothetical protein|tara:strand:- start:278 stop:802 length:525 start_codon:yes stop_codon:yes gene_type:complete
MSQKDIYTKDALIYNPLLDNLTESVMSGDKRHEFLNLIRQIESGGKYRPLLGTTDFPYGNPQAKADTTTASGVYQFTKKSVDTAKQRARNLGFDAGFINLIPNDPTQWTNKEADIMALANLFAQSKIKPGFVDELLIKAFGGDRQAMQDAYNMLHHTKPDEATKNRVNQIMPIV